MKNNKFMMKTMYAVAIVIILLNKSILNPLMKGLHVRISN